MVGVLDLVHRCAADLPDGLGDAVHPVDVGLTELSSVGVQRQPSAEWVAGKSFMGGTWRGAPEPAKRVLRAIDPRDGRIVWELPQEGRVNSWGGVLSTASGLVFFCSDDGAFAAADSKTGKLLWSAPSMQLWKASPMTYVFDDQQHVAVANGGDIVAFALPM